MIKQKPGAEQVLQKARYYCTYQERSHFEVTDKLYSLGLYKTDVEKIVSQLIEEGYLNEERFAIHFAAGRFRLKKWGKVKIQHELKQKRVSSYNIKKALKEIDEEEYEITLKKLAAEKWGSLEREQYRNRISKTTNYLLQKGYETQLINTVITDIRTAGY